MRTCSFFGHRILLADIENILTRQIEYAIVTLGVTDFYVGSFGQFEKKVADVMVYIRKRFPTVKLYLIGNPNKKDYDKKLYDGTINLEYPKNQNQNIIIQKRNEFMISKSDIVISYVAYRFGNSQKAISYAQNHKKLVLECT